MDLQTYQRSLRRLVIGGQPTPDDPPYVQALAGSPRLAVVRQVIDFWRAHGLERFCVLSATWLKRQGRFDADIDRFVARGEFSADIAEAGQQFLRHLTGDADPLVGALARFELALHETRLDPAESRTLDWPCDPRPVLAAILGQPTDPIDPMADGSGPQRVTVSRSLPGGYTCTPLPSEPMTNAREKTS